MNSFPYIKTLVTKPNPPQRYFIIFFANTLFNPLGYHDETEYSMDNHYIYPIRGKLRQLYDLKNKRLETLCVYCIGHVT